MKELKLNVNGQELTTFMSEQNGEQLIALKPLCEALGVRYPQQRQRLQANPQFSVALLKGGNSADGKRYNMLCIPAREVGMWICSINANRVRPEVRDGVIVFQKYLQEVIFQALTSQLTPEMMRDFTQELKHLKEELAAQRIKLAALEIDNIRLQQANVSAGASLLSHQRWAKRDKRNIKVY